MLKNNQIFIHIPKTGGTTLNCLFFGEDTPINPNYNYRHIVYETKRSNSGDIFNPMKNDKYLDSQIFMMLRHPVDRIISEYYFLRERSEFFKILKPTPKSFKEYVNNSQTFNYNISFLLGNKIYNKEKVTEEDYNMVINAIEKLDIKIGINEYFEDSLHYFSNLLGFKVPQKVKSKRITLKRPKLEDISADLYEKILINNSLDYKLYNYAINKFYSLDIKKKSSIKFEANKYDYAIVYCNRFSLFEIELTQKKFIKINSIFFKELTNYLHNANIKDSKLFVQVYVSETLKALKNKFSKFDFSSLENQIKDKEPLEVLSLISQTINKNNRLTTKPLTFEEDKVIVPKQELKLFSALKSLFKS